MEILPAALMRIYDTSLNNMIDAMQGAVSAKTNSKLVIN